MKSGYKQTEVGVIPEDWEVFSLSSLTEPQRPISYGIVQTGPNVPNGVRCLRVLDIQDGLINTAELITTSKRISDSYRRTVLKAGDLVMPLRGKVGDVGLVDEELDGANLTRGVALIAIRTGYSPVFCQQVISSASTRRRLEQAMNGSALQELPIASLRSFKIATPKSLPEQRAIAGALSEVDALLGAQEALLAKKRDLKQAAMQQLLTGQKRLPSFTGEWQVKCLGEVAELITKGTTPTSIGQNFTESGVNFLKAESISENGSIIAEKTAYIDNATHALLRRSQLKDGDLLISIAGVLGRIGTVSSDVLPANTNQALAIVRLPKNSTESRHYIFYFLRSSLIHKQINDVNVQAAQSNISLQNVGDLQIHLPPPAEQTAIAAVLSDMDAEIAALEAQRDKTRTLKQGMMQELLTGRIRLV